MVVKINDLILKPSITTSGVYIGEEMSAMFIRIGVYGLECRSVGHTFPKVVGVDLV